MKDYLNWEEEKLLLNKQFRKLLDESIQTESKAFKKQLVEIGERINKLEEENEFLNQFFKAS